MEGKDWRHQAACKTEEPELFFPTGKTGPALRQAEEAKVVCRRCPVREQCLLTALELSLDHGIWGGMDEEERRALRRRRTTQQTRRALGRASLA